MLELDDIAVDIRDQAGYPVQLARLVRQQDGDRKDPVAQDQALLDDRGHGDDVHIAAAQDTDHLLVPAVDVAEGRHGQKAGVLDHHLVVLDHVQEGRDQLLVGDRDDFIQVLLQIREDPAARRLDRRAVRDRIDLGKRDDLPRLQRGLEAGRPLRLHRDHLHIGLEELGKRRDARRQAASADRDQDDVHQRQVLDDLHGDRPLTGRDVRIVKGMDKGIAVLLGQGMRVRLGIVIDIAVQDDLGAQRLGPVDLDQGRRRGHDDHRPGPELPRRIGHALGVVAGGRRDQAPGPRLLRQRADLVVGPAHLVGAGPLHILGLEIDLSPGLLAEIIRIDQLGVQGHTVDGFAGLLELFQGEGRLCQFCCCSF